MTATQWLQLAACALFIAGSLCLAAATVIGGSS